MQVGPEAERRARASRMWLVRSRRALVFVAASVNALALALFLYVSSGDGSVLDMWPFWLVLVAIPLSLTLIAPLRLFRAVAVVLGMVSISAGLLFSLVTPAFFLIPSGVALAAAGLLRATPDGDLSR